MSLSSPQSNKISAEVHDIITQGKEVPMTTRGKRNPWKAKDSNLSQHKVSPICTGICTLKIKGFVHNFLWEPVVPSPLVCTSNGTEQASLNQKKKKKKQSRGRTHHLNPWMQPAGSLPFSFPRQLFFPKAYFWIFCSIYVLEWYCLHTLSEAHQLWHYK